MSKAAKAALAAFDAEHAASVPSAVIADRNLAEDKKVYRCGDCGYLEAGQSIRLRRFDGCPNCKCEDNWTEDALTKPEKALKALKALNSAK